MDKDYKMIENMERYGGSFVVALAECLTRADRYNYRKLIDAFPEYVAEYRKEHWSKKDPQ